MSVQKPHILLITTDEQHRDTIFAPRKPYSLPGLEHLITEILDMLKARKIPCGIATSNSRVLTEAILKSHRIEDYFSSMVTGDEIIHGKPNPEVYLEAAKRLGVSPGRCLVFEDIPFGIIAGKRAGMTVCAVEDEYSVKDREEKIRLADFYIESYEELL